MLDDNRVWLDLRTHLFTAAGLSPVVSPRVCSYEKGKHSLYSFPKNSGGVKRSKDLKIYVNCDVGISYNEDVEQGLSGVIAIGDQDPGFESWCIFGQHRVLREQVEVTEPSSWCALVFTSLLISSELVEGVSADKPGHREKRCCFGCIFV